MNDPLQSSLFQLRPQAFRTLNLLIYTDPFAEADEDTGETKQSQNYIHIRIQRTLDTLKIVLRR